jgi:hypothetical protein
MVDIRTMESRKSTLLRLAGAGILTASLGITPSIALTDKDEHDTTIDHARSKKAGCDDRLRMVFKRDAHTRVLLVKEFKQGDPVALANTPSSPPPPPAPVDLCLVKVLVGPGNPGPADAPSTSAGIGIEIWLPAPASWNERIRAYGSGGWAGGFHTDITRLGGAGSVSPIHLAAVGKGYVVSSSDHGHRTVPSGRNGSFTMNPDGSINTVLWHDFSERSLHEQAVKTKALTKIFYGKPQKYAYWDGFSTGGRQGYKLAQEFPGDFDGILAGAPAFNWTRFITNELYPQVVMLRDLGGVIPVAKLDAVSAAAVAACGGTSLGFLLNPLQCRYDPTKDSAALCSGVAGNGGVTGTNTDAATCVNLAEATAINKIWYGQTADGSVADPANDNASSPTLGSSNHLWWGLTRGTTLGSLAGASPFPIATDMVAIELQDPTYAEPTFTNATGNGMNRWMDLDYAGLANAYFHGLALQPFFSDINTDDPDLSGVRDRGVKLLSYHGLADDLIMPQGSINYFVRASSAMGGNMELQEFNRLFLIPGHAHDSTFARSGSLDPATGAPTSADKVPLPQPSTGRDELFNALVDWVENGQAPSRIEVSSADGSVTLPICSYPERASYNGSGPVTLASSYSCQ